MPEMKWHDRRERMPTRTDTDEDGFIWAWDGLQVHKLKRAQFEKDDRYTKWMARMSQPKPTMPERIA